MHFLKLILFTWLVFIESKKSVLDLFSPAMFRQGSSLPFKALFSPTGPLLLQTMQKRKIRKGPFKNAPMPRHHPAFSCSQRWPPHLVLFGFWDLTCKTEGLSLFFFVSVDLNFIQKENLKAQTSAKCCFEVTSPVQIVPVIWRLSWVPCSNFKVLNWSFSK